MEQDQKVFIGITCINFITFAFIIFNHDQFSFPGDVKEPILFAWGSFYLAVPYPC